MEFHVKPVLQQMADLYDLPRGKERFEQYLLMLQGTNKGEMILPIAGYNPMGKEHVQQRIKELMDLNAEEVIAEELIKINSSYAPVLPNQSYEVVINLSDDLGGAWTDRYASHYKNTFDFVAITKRSFCTPSFWTSDMTFTQDLIIQRTQEAIFRTLYFLQYGKPQTLKDHVKQEVYVAQQIGGDQKEANINLESVHQFYETHQNTDDYSIIFNFFYGDKASTQLGYKAFGNPESAGFNFAARTSFHL